MELYESLTVYKKYQEGVPKVTLSGDKSATFRTGIYPIIFLLLQNDC